VIKGREDLRDAYRDQSVASEYIERRFRSPLGALLHDRQSSVIRGLIEEHAIRNVAEIAPGPARLTTAVAPLVERITLVDTSAQMLAEARRRLAGGNLRCRTQVVQADAFALPLLAGFDLLYSFRLIRHFERSDRVLLYQQVRSVLRPRAWLVFDAVNEEVSAPLRAAAAPGEYEHFDALLRPASLREELGEAGFEITSLVGVQHRYGALLKCQIYLAPRSTRLARAAMGLIDRCGGEPLEWVVVCRKR
jgi:SAM-dependent methyltransferase